MNNEYSIKILDKLNNSIIEKWKNSNISKENFFSTYDWHNTFYEIYKQKKYYFIIFYKNEKECLLLPLVKSKKIFFNYLIYNGFPFNDKSDFIIINNYEFDIKDFEFFLKIFINHLHKLDFLLINNVSKLSYLNLFLKKKKIVYETLYNYQINNFSNYKFDFNKKFNFDTQRQIKRSKQKYKNVSFHVCDKKNDIEEVLNFFIKNKELQIKSTGNFNYLNNIKSINNFKYMFQLLGNKIHYSCLKFDQRIVACHIGYLDEKIFYYIFPTYDKSVSNLSPGNILLFYLLRSLDSKIKIFDFTVGNEEYKKRISNQIYQSENIFYPISKKSYFIKYFFNLIKLIKSFKFAVSFYRIIKKYV